MPILYIARCYFPARPTESLPKPPGKLRTTYAEAHDDMRYMCNGVSISNDPVIKAAFGDLKVEQSADGQMMFLVKRDTGATIMMCWVGDVYRAEWQVEDEAQGGEQGQY